MSTQYRINFWNRNTISVIFLLVLFLSQLNFNYLETRANFLQKSALTYKKSIKCSLTDQGSNWTQSDDQSDFEEAESDDVFDFNSFDIQDRIFRFFVTSSEYLQSPYISTVNSSQPLYILFCKLKIHLI